MTKIAFLFTGKTRVSFVAEGLDFYIRRIRNYLQVDVLETADIKGIQDSSSMKQSECEKVLKMLAPDDYVVLLDEKGQQFKSMGMALSLGKIIDSGAKRIVFVIAGAYGATDALREKARQIWSLSELTFPHQLVRLILSEQVYRSLTILRKEPYHHEG